MNIIGEIKYYLDDDYAHLKFSESKETFSIDTVMVPASYRNSGIGTILINRILFLADCLGKEVRLSARPIGSVSEEKLERLTAFYKRLGFKVLDRGLTVSYMARHVKKIQFQGDLKKHR